MYRFDGELDVTSCPLRVCRSHSFVMLVSTLWHRMTRPYHHTWLCGLARSKVPLSLSHILSDENAKTSFQSDNVWKTTNDLCIANHLLAIFDNTCNKLPRDADLRNSTPLLLEASQS